MVQVVLVQFVCNHPIFDVRTKQWAVETVTELWALDAGGTANIVDRTVERHPLFTKGKA